MPDQKKSYTAYDLANDTNLAYEVNTLPSYAPDEYRTPAPEQTRKPAAAPRHAARQSIAPGAVLGYLVAAVMLAAVLLARIQLTTANADTMAMRSTVEDLQAEHELLKAEYETVFNRKDVEEYAREMLDMEKPSAANIVYIHTVKEDKAVVLRDTESSGLLESVREFIRSATEYFHRK